MKKEIITKVAAVCGLLVTVCLAYFCAAYIRGGADGVVSIARSWNTQGFARAAVTNNTTPTTTTVQVLPTADLSQCLTWASQTYNVPLATLAAIMRVEGGRIGQGVHNKNGTYDLGLMQVNSIWIPQLAHIWHVDYATAYHAIRDNGCENVYIGAWILKQKIAQTGDLYSGISYYHSASPRLGSAYANKVIDNTPPPLLQTIPARTPF